MSKFDQNRIKDAWEKTLHKQTKKQTNRHYENNGHLAVNQKLKERNCIWNLCMFGGSYPLAEFCQVQNSLCVHVLRSPVLAALLHGTRAVGVSQTLGRDTRNVELRNFRSWSVSAEGATYIPKAAITLGIHSSW